MREIAAILKNSIQYSLDHRRQAVDHALQYARDMGHDLADRFVGMYVNEWTLDYGDRGRAAIRELLSSRAQGGPGPGRRNDRVHLTDPTRPAAAAQGRGCGDEGARPRFECPVNDWPRRNDRGPSRFAGICRPFGAWLSHTAHNSGAYAPGYIPSPLRGG